MALTLEVDKWEVRGGGMLCGWAGWGADRADGRFVFLLVLLP